MCPSDAPAGLALRPRQLPGLVVEPRDGESADHLVRRFRRLVDHAGVLADLRRRRCFRTPREILHRKRRIVKRREQQRQERRR